MQSFTLKAVPERVLDLAIILSALLRCDTLNRKKE